MRLMKFEAPFAGQTFRGHVDSVVAHADAGPLPTCPYRLAQEAAAGIQMILTALHKIAWADARDPLARMYHLELAAACAAVSALTGGIAALIGAFEPEVAAADATEVPFTEAEATLADVEVPASASRPAAPLGELIEDGQVALADLQSVLARLQHFAS